jgi:hypothetical protein
MALGESELKTFTAAIIEALCDVSVKASRLTPDKPGDLVHMLKKFWPPTRRATLTAPALKPQPIPGFNVLPYQVF